MQKPNNTIIKNRKPKRNIILKGLIISGLLGFPYGVYKSLLYWQMHGSLSVSLVIISLLAESGIFICTLGMWKWKKWGLYGQIAIGLISGILYIFIGQGWFSLIAALLFTFILLIVISPVWEGFE